MPQIKLPLIAIFIAAGLTLGGCGDKNDNAVFSQETAHRDQTDWVHTHKTAATADLNALNSCTECHGGDFSGGISRVSCGSNQTALIGFTCHAASNAAVTTTGCISCHGTLPNGPFGATAPNRKFAHTDHTALLTQIGVTGKGICDTCHPNAGSGTADHARATAAGGRSSATVNISGLSSGFRANNPAVPVYDKTTGSCANISCHGGKATPAWSASFDMVSGDNTVCLQCHEAGTAVGTPQANSFYSGIFSGSNPPTSLHTSHLARNAFCSDCHNIYALTGPQTHFGGITLNGVSLNAPGKTVGGNPPTKIGTYNTSSQTCSNVLCHPQFDRSWNN